MACMSLCQIRGVDRSAMNDPKTAADSMFCRAVVRVFDEVLAHPARRCLVRPGALVLDASFASESFADAYLSSFLQIRNAPADVRIGVIGASDIDLSDLIPHPAAQSHNHVTDGCFGAWHAGPKPVLYVLDRNT